MFWFQTLISITSSTFRHDVVFIQQPFAMPLLFLKDESTLPIHVCVCVCVCVEIS